MGTLKAEMLDNGCFINARDARGASAVTALHTA